MSEVDPIAEEAPTSASRAILVGGAAAALVAVIDFAGVSSFVEAGEAPAVILGLLAALVPVGVLLGGLAGLVERLGAPLATKLAHRLARGADPGQWERRLAPLPLVVASAPALIAIAVLLFSGGRASRVPARPLLIVLAALVQLGGVWALVRLGRPLLRAALRPTLAILVATGAFGAVVALCLVDQRAYPTHYAYLHGALSFAAWSFAAFGLLALGRAMKPRASWSRRTGALSIATLAGALVAAHLTLDGGGRVGTILMHPRAANTRTVLEGLGPLLASRTYASDSAREDAARRREARRRRRAEAGGPVSPDAHILLISVDALRADHLGLYGYRRPVSETLDAFAAESVVFERAYAQAPHSSYSLTSLHASEYLHEVVELGRPLPEATLASVLREHGYQTHGFYIDGIFHTAGERLEPYRTSSFGFEHHHSRVLDAEGLTDAALRELELMEVAGEPSSFLWLHYFDAHHPYRETSLGTSEIDRYDGEIRNVDRALERLLEGVSQLSRPVVIALTADHGEEFRDHGGVYHGTTLYDEQARVPLIVRAPDVSPRRVSAPVELVDLAPTLLALAGVEPAPTMRGDDLRGLMTGEDEELGPAFIGVGHLRGVIEEHEKLIVDLRLGHDQLYDLTVDPFERHNIAGDHPERVDRLRGEIDAWLEAVASPPGGAPVDPRVVALGRARMGDRRSTPALETLVADTAAPSADRAEACRLLGTFREPTSFECLAGALSASTSEVADEAAIALARLRDDRGRARLHTLLDAQDPQLALRSAVALAILGDPRAVQPIVAGLGRTDDRRLLREAIRHLARLGGRAAYEPILGQLPRFETATTAAVALGMLGDRRATAPLIDRLASARYSSMRDAAARGLGHLGDPSAVAPLLAALPEPELTSVPESLVRLRAIERSQIGGVDVSMRLSSSIAWAECHTRPPADSDGFAHQTRCDTASATTPVSLRVPRVVARSASPRLILSARRLDSDAPTRLRIRLGEHVVPVDIDGRWTDARIALPPSALRAGRLDVVLEADDEATRLSVDHLLLIP